MNTQSLRSLAEKATPGPWVAGLSTGSNVNTQHVSEAKDDVGTIADFCNYTDAQDKANARYVAACDPQTILSILDRLEQLERDYYELIMQVSKAYPDESRHQTALRYLREREVMDQQPTNAQCSAESLPREEKQ